MRKNPRDKESDLPKAYIKGLSTATAKARKAHWDRANKLSDRDPRAYEPAPGDAGAKTVPSKATREIQKIMNKEEIEITEEAENSLAAKSKKFGVPLGTLKTVYKRGVAAWNSGHRPGTNAQQWGHARVNSYLRKGKGTYHGADKDLREAKDSREYGYEGEMVMSQLKGIMNHANQMHNMLEPDTDLPEWVQSKITLAYDYMQTAADYMSTEMSEEVNKDAVRVGRVAHVQAYRADKAKKAGTNLKMDPDTGTPDYFTAAMRRKKGLPEEVAYSVHVKTYDSQGKKQMNSPEFKKHISAHGGKLDYASDKGAAFKFASHSHAAAFHRGVQSKFRELDSEHDINEEKLPFKGPYKKVGPRRDEYGNIIKNVPKHLAKKAIKDLTKEEVAVNAAGAGNVAGIGVGPQGEPGVHMKKKKKPVIASFKRFAKK